jgi:HK97 family phage portal protein
MRLPSLKSWAGRLKASARLATIAAVSLGSIWSGHGGDGVGSRWTSWLPGSSFDYEKEAGDLWANSTVAIALRWIGDNYTKPIMRVSKITARGNYKPVGNHDMVKRWNRPNPHYSGRTLSKAVALSLKVDGNAYVLKLRDSFGKVAELWWVPHWQIAPIWPIDGSVYISGYKLEVDGRAIEVRSRDVIHFRDGIDPRNDRLGLAALKAQFREVCTDNETSGYTASILRNAGVPSVAVVPGEGSDEITQDEADTIKSRFKDANGGDERGGVVVFAKGAKVTQLGYSPEQLKLEKLPDRAISKITAATGTNNMVLGLPDPNKTYANLAEAKTSAWENGLVPLMDLVADQLRWSLLNEYEDPDIYTVEYDTTHVEALQENQSLKSTRIVNEFKGGIIRCNEAREALGYDGDYDGEAGERWFPMTGADPEPPEPKLPPGTPPGSPTDPPARGGTPGEDDDEKDD